MKVRTTIQPDQVLEVTEQEADSLRFQGLLIDDPYTGEIPAARRRAATDKVQED